MSLKVLRSNEHSISVPLIYSKNSSTLTGATISFQTPSAVISNPVQHSTFQIPSLNPIPLSLNTTMPAQILSQNPPSSSTQNHSTLQTTSSTTQSTSYNPYISLYPTFQNFPTTPSKSPYFAPSHFNIIIQSFFLLSFISFSNHSFCSFCCTFQPY